ncbi:phospholipid carrier-dependent glycosyltransferase [[Clostridium] polysaccharolyticum]|uniref:Polyprenol-phosphate-mannose--protein mannosyltransferase n=1 Tax=[Clostridium] polysaccharolyticum TaxID=29364 RepID=A0A1I0B2M9_9FIRM|nr:phospholipid carrier-dependent glycosyltransferase [[Clostridium] polysaccharolyticum]SET00752.1 Dolichyl-phosphate-mannose-protein mannosyltransferase [[Clostridium] polysaccharolyticum]
MEAMVFLSVVFLCLMYYTYFYMRQDRKISQEQTTKELQAKYWLVLLLAAGFILRVIVGARPNTKSGDLSNFRWAMQTLMDNGYKSVYQSGVNISFPPLLVQIIGVIGLVCRVFRIKYETLGSTAAILIFKMPGIIAELVTAAMIYKAAKANFAKRSTLILAGLFLINPVAVFDTGIWGQMDSVVSLCVILMCWYLYQKKTGKAIIAFVAAVLMHPLMIILAPVLFIGVVDGLVLDGFEAKKTVQAAACLAGSIMAAIMMCLPMGLSTVWDNVKQTYNGYLYCSVNAYNFWNMIGYNWTPETATYLGITCRVWGCILIGVLLCASIAWHYLNKRKKEDYFYLAGLVLVGVFTFSTRMHERYLYNAMAVFLMLYAVKPFIENYIFYGLFTMVQFGNMVFVYYVYDANKFNPRETVPMYVSRILFLGFIALVVMSIYRLKSKALNEENVSLQTKANENESKEEKGFVIERTSKVPKWSKFDTIALLAILIVYSAFALHDIGYRYAPETSWTYNVSGQDASNQILLDLGDVKQVQALKYYLGNYENRQMKVEYAQDINGEWVSAFEGEWVSVFCWGENALNVPARYIRITCNSDKAVVWELAIKDDAGNLIMPVNAKEYKNLFDEQKMVPKRSTFRDSTYFDEIYHARTAYEFIHGLPTYEYTHPPLGKVIMSIGIRLFGMNPFGWRIMGILFGIGMVPVFYAFSRRMFKETWIASVSTILFAFDFMHFSQTRIATIDVFVTFFIIASYYFMYRYYKTSFYDTSLKQTFVLLGCCGVLMGCQMAAKWTGVYAAFGLAVIFFVTLGKRYREFLYAKKDMYGSTNGIEHQYIVKNFVPYAWKTVLFCCVVFVIIPAVIYTLSYIPFQDYDGTKGLVARMLKNQQNMLNYHKGVTESHPFESRWWQWPIMYRPIWYFSGSVSGTVSEGISAFGNPAVWWAGIPAFFVLIQRAFRKKDKMAVFLIAGYMSQYLPWVFVGRTTFIYHYFTSVPFVTLMVAYCLYLLVKEKKWNKGIVFAYAAVACVLFVMFYPVLSGQPVNREYVFHFLRWMDSWVLVG